MEEKIIKNNAIIILLIIILFTAKIPLIEQYNTYIIFLLQIICIIYNISKNQEKKIYGIGYIVLSVSLFAITLIIDILGEYSNQTIKTTAIVFLNIILFVLMFCSVKKNLNDSIYNTFSKYFIIYILILCFYAIIIRFFGGTPVYFNTDENGGIQYVQTIRILGINFSQIAIGDTNSFGFGVSSLTGNPNTLSYLVLLGEIIYIFLKFDKNILIKNIFIMSIFVITIIISGSRLAIMLFVLVIISKIFLFNKKSLYKSKKVFVIKLLSVIALICIILSILLLNDINLLDNLNLNGRENMWDIALNEIRSNIFEMNGLGASKQILAERLGIETSMHNTYLELALSYGVFITIIFVLYNIKVIISSIKFLINSVNVENLSIILSQIILLVIILLIGLSESTIMTFSAYNILYFYVILNILTTLKREK